MKHPNSIYAYGYISASGKRATQGMAVFKCIQRNKRGVTRQEISAKTGIPINVVCARVGDMIGKSIFESGSRKNQKTGMPNAVLKVVS